MLINQQFNCVGDFLTDMADLLFLSILWLTISSSWMMRLFCVDGITILYSYNMGYFGFNFSKVIVLAPFYDF